MYGRSEVLAAVERPIADVEEGRGEVEASGASEFGALEEGLRTYFGEYGERVVVVVVVVVSGG